MTLKNKDLDVYFHMRNHYKRLEHIKSTLNFSPPKAIAKRAFCSSPHCNTAQKTMKFEVTHFSNMVHIPYYDVPKRHICAYSTDRISDTALLPRPRTRRSPNVWSPEEMLDRKYRSQSLGGIPIKMKTSKKTHGYSPRQFNTDQDSLMGDPCDYNNYSRQCHHNKRKKKTNTKSNLSVSCSTNTGIEEESEITGSSRRSSEKKTGIGDTRSATSVEEHEYLQFLLRVTEDIIINNYILNEDIERVFKEHIEMNRHALDEKKMEQHIANLAVELNISEDQTNVRKDCPLEGSSCYMDLCLNTSCPCETPTIPLDGLFMPLAEQNKYCKENLDEIIYYRHSLGRVTECTEPSNSSATVVAKISDPNFLHFGNAEYPMTETQSEMIVASNEDVGKELHIRETLSEIVISDKSSPEDSLKDIPKETGKTYIIEPTKDNKITEENPIKESPRRVDCSTETTSCEGNLQKVDVQIQANLPPQRLFEQSSQTSPILILEKTSTLNKSTQSTSIVSNKKCDTEDFSEYVMVTNVIPKEDFSGSQEYIPEDELPLSNRTELEGGLNTFLELKLLGDDYDLTPERDTSEKYHFLMTDAATSMVQSTVTATGIDEESLLVGDMYNLSEDSTVQKTPIKKGTYSYMPNKKVPGFEDEISSSSDHVQVFRDSPGWLSDKINLRFSTTRKLDKFAPVIPKLNTCTSTSSTSVTT